MHVLSLAQSMRDRFSDGLEKAFMTDHLDNRYRNIFFYGYIWTRDPPGQDYSGKLKQAMNILR